MDSAAKLRRVDRKFEALFGKSREAKDTLDDLRNGALRDKVMAYGLNFVEQYLEVEETEVAEVLVQAYSSARKQVGLADDRRALLLRPKVLKARADTLKDEWSRLQAGTNSATRQGINEAQQKHRRACAALNHAQTALQEYQRPESVLQALSSVSITPGASNPARPTSMAPTRLSAAQSPRPMSSAASAQSEERWAQPIISGTPMGNGRRPSAGRTRDTPSASVHTPAHRQRLSLEQEMSNRSCATTSAGFMSPSLVPTAGLTSPSLVTDRFKCNLASPAEGSLHLPTPGTKPRRPHPVAETAPLLGAFAASQPVPTPATVADGKTWTAQMASWQQHSAQLRWEAEEMLAALPSHCRSGSSAETPPTANLLQSEPWVYKYLLYSSVAGAPPAICST